MLVHSSCSVIGKQGRVKSSEVPHQPLNLDSCPKLKGYAMKGLRNFNMRIGLIRQVEIIGLYRTKMIDFKQWLQGRLSYLFGGIKLVSERSRNVAIMGCQIQHTWKTKD